MKTEESNQIISPSKVGKLPIELPAGFEASVTNGCLEVSHKGSTTSMPLHKAVLVECKDNVLSFSARVLNQESKKFVGTMRALAYNLIHGLDKGFEKQLELHGVGYRAKLVGKNIELSVGFSNPVSFVVAEGVSIDVPEPTKIVVTGADKQKVGQVAANIRAIRPPEPYKGKGIRYKGEVIFKKEVKK